MISYARTLPRTARLKRKPVHRAGSRLASLAASVVGVSLSDAEIVRRLRGTPTLFANLSPEQRRVPRSYRGPELAGE